MCRLGRYLGEWSITTPLKGQTEPFLLRMCLNSWLVIKSPEKNVCSCFLGYLPIPCGEGLPQGYCLDTVYLMLHWSQTGRGSGRPGDGRGRKRREGWEKQSGGSLNAFPTLWDLTGKLGDPMGGNKEKTKLYCNLSQVHWCSYPEQSITLVLALFHGYGAGSHLWRSVPLSQDHHFMWFESEELRGQLAQMFLCATTLFLIVFHCKYALDVHILRHPLKVLGL